MANEVTPHNVQARVGIGYLLKRLPSPSLCLLLVLCVMTVWRPLSGSSDFWGLAAMGRWMFANGDVPRERLFLWSDAQPGVDHSWLTQFVFFALSGGASEDYTIACIALGFTAVVVAGTYLVAWRLWSGSAPTPAWLALPFALGIVANFKCYLARPELFTGLFLALLLANLTRWAATSDPDSPTERRSWLAFAGPLALVVVWANFHSGVIVGLALLAATAACELVQARANPPARRLALLVLAAPLAVCINPYGVAYWRAHDLLTYLHWAHTADDAPLWTPEELPLDDLGVQVLLLFLAITAWAMHAPRRWAHMAWLAMLTTLCVYGHCCSWLLTIASLTVLAANNRGLASDRLWRTVFGRHRSASANQDPRSSATATTLGWVVRVALASWLVLMIMLRVFVLKFCDDPTLERTRPKGVVEFVQEHPLNGRIFNDLENSGYLEWHLAGQPPLFIDNHQAYPDKIARAYLNVIQVSPRGRRWLEAQGIDYVILTVNRPGPNLVPFARFLDKAKSWKRIYAGDDGVIWARWTANNKQRWDSQHRAANRVSFAALAEYHRGEHGAHTQFNPP
jgi:hypothetical protein